jgi:DNA-binding response OmpR family regulator
MAENELKKVLYVENDRATLLILKRLISKDYNFFSAESAHDALKQINSEKFDVILLDINLGGEVNGIDIFHAIRNSSFNKKAIVFAVTTRTFGDEDSRILDEGFDGYFPKPFDVDSIKRSLDFMLKK